MCRLILAHGQFDTTRMLEATVDMSQGKTANHDGPTNVHPNGWGVVWRERDAGDQIKVYRSTEPLCIASMRSSPAWSAQADLLAVHARHATIPSKLGIEFTHPLTRGGKEGLAWHFMHNGYTPTIYTLLGRPVPSFDSADYFDYLIDANVETLDRNISLQKLAAVPLGNSAGNAIAINSRYAYIVHYPFPGIPYLSYFQMFRLQADNHVVYSSEALPQLAPVHYWQNLPSREIFEIQLS